MYYTGILVFYRGIWNLFLNVLQDWREIQTVETIAPSSAIYLDKRQKCHWQKKSTERTLGAKLQKLYNNKTKIKLRREM